GDGWSCCGGPSSHRPNEFQRIGKIDFGRIGQRLLHRERRATAQRRGPDWLLSSRQFNRKDRGRTFEFRWRVGPGDVCDIGVGCLCVADGYRDGDIGYGELAALSTNAEVRSESAELEKLRTLGSLCSDFLLLHSGFLLLHSRFLLLHSDLHDISIRKNFGGEGFNFCAV